LGDIIILFLASRDVLQYIKAEINISFVSIICIFPPLILYMRWYLLSRNWHEINIISLFSNVTFQWRHRRHLTKSSTCISSLKCLARNRLLVAYHISRFTFKAILIWEMHSRKTNQLYYRVSVQIKNHGYLKIILISILSIPDVIRYLLESWINISILIFKTIIYPCPPYSMLICNT